MVTERDVSESASGESEEAVASVAGTQSQMAATAVAIESDVFCPDCGYNLRTLTSDRCPECGVDVRLIRERKSQIPWIYRDTQGAFRSYWKTVWMVTFKSRQFCTEMARPVDLGHARRFRWVTMFHACLPIAALTPFVFTLAIVPLSWETGITAAVLNLAVFAFFSLAAAVPYYAFRHRDLPLEAQHRAAVLMNYICAPMAWMFLAVVFGMAGLIARSFSGWWRDLDLIMFMTAIGILLAIWGVMMTDEGRIVRKTVGERRIAWPINARLFLIRGITLFVTILGIPAVVFYVATICYDIIG